MKKLAFILMFVFLVSSGAEAKIYIDITAVSDRSFPIAIVPPWRDGGDSEATKWGEEFARVLANDLELMGIFRFLKKETFLETKQTLVDSTIDFASWAVIDALALVKGWCRLKGGKLTLEAHLYDVLLKKEISAKRYEGTTDQTAWMAHRFANEVMRVLTGQAGIFDTKIAFVARSGGAKDLYAMDFNGDHLTKLTNDRSIVLSPEWGKDGKTIYYTSFRDGNIPQLYRYDLSRSSFQRVAKLPGMVFSITLDPSADILATSLAKDGNTDIFLLNFSGGIVDRLTRGDDPDVSPSFSPDGKQVVFISGRDGSPQVYKMDRSGGNVTRLTFKGLNNTAPAWSPRGDKIAFAGMDTDGHFDIFTMNPDGSNMVRLTYDTRNNQEPSWAPDGQMIVFSSNRAGKYQIYTMRPDGGHQVKLTSDPIDHDMPAWGPKPK